LLIFFGKSGAARRSIILCNLLYTVYFSIFLFVGSNFAVWKKNPKVIKDTLDVSNLGRVLGKVGIFGLVYIDWFCGLNNVLDSLDQIVSSLLGYYICLY
jgi:hypothetical protein